MKASTNTQLTLYLSSLLSLFTSTLLGFLDDLFDIRWRHKLPIPIIAAVPTLLVYYSEGGLTSIVLPSAVGRWMNSLGLPGWIGSKVVDLGMCCRESADNRPTVLSLSHHGPDIYHQRHQHSRRDQWRRSDTSSDHRPLSAAQRSALFAHLASSSTCCFRRRQSA